jgi:ABC-2 type transport system permease protein
LPKMIVVGLREFRQKVRNRGFLLGSLGVPLLLLAVFAAGGLGGGSSESVAQELSQVRVPERPIGYVDHAGLIGVIPEPAPGDLFRSYPDVETAQAALRRGELAAYYRIPADYRETGEVQRVSAQMPTAPPDTRLFNWILVGNLLPEGSSADIAQVRRPFNGSSPLFVDLAEAEPDATGGGFDVLPLFATVAVIVPLFTSGGYLFQSLAQEKESRIMEILLSSLRPHELLGGKLLGLGLLTAVQYTIWVVIAGVALSFTGQDVSSLIADLNLTTGELLWAVPFALGGFVLYASLMAGLGAMSPDMESSRLWVFILTAPMVLPLWLSGLVMGDPNGPLATALSLIPYSAPVAMLMRMTSTAVPVWHLGLAVLLLVLAGVLTVWLMARLFRVQTLLSGEAFSLGRAWSTLAS